MQEIEYSCNHVLALPGAGCRPTLATDVFRANGPGRKAAQKIADLLFYKLLVPRSGYGPHNYKIYTPRKPLPAEFVGEQFDHSVQFRCGAWVKLKHVIMSRAATLGGDSGSPLIGSDGTLYGMHFYLTGSKPGSNKPKYALAIPAHALFEDGTWPIRIRLAT